MTDSHPSDISAQATYLGRDDKAWREERKRKHRRYESPPDTLPDGPCCARRANWFRVPGDDFGECRLVIVATERVPGAIERGTAMTRVEATERYYVAGEPLRTRGPFGGCPVYEAREDKEDA